MKAVRVGGLPNSPMWKVEGPTNYYFVSKWKYTAHRLVRGGKTIQASVMSHRFDVLRLKIDAAIAAVEEGIQ